MDLALEIILWSIAAPVLEGILIAFFGVIATKWKWHPLKNKFNKTITDASEKSFVMAADADTKAVQILALIFASLGLAFAIVFPILLYVNKQANTIEIIATALLFHSIMLPLFLWALHSATKKIYVSESNIFVKSAIFLKRIQLCQIVEVAETAYTPAMKMLLMKYEHGKHENSLKIKETFGNYELAKKLLLSAK